MGYKGLRLAPCAAIALVFLVFSCSMDLEPAKSGATSVSFTIGTRDIQNSSRAVAPGPGYLYIRTVGGPGDAGGTFLGPFPLESGSTFTTTDIPAGAYKSLGVLYATELLDEREMVFNGNPMTFTQLMHLPDDQFETLVGQLKESKDTSDFERLIDGFASVDFLDTVVIRENRKNELSFTLVPVCGDSHLSLANTPAYPDYTGYSEPGHSDRLVRKYIKLEGITPPAGLAIKNLVCGISAGDGLYIRNLTFFDGNGIQTGAMNPLNAELTSDRTVSAVWPGSETCYLYIEYRGSKLALSMSLNIMQGIPIKLYLSQFSTGVGDGSTVENAMSLDTFQEYLNEEVPNRYLEVYVDGNLLLFNRTLSIRNVGLLTILSQGTIANSLNVDEGSRVVIEQGCSVKIFNFTIQGNSDPAGSPLISVAGGGSLALGTGSVIRNRTNTAGVGGVYVGGGGSLTMSEGALISNCSGGVHLEGSDAYTSFLMEGGTIANCSTSTSGGGVYVYNNAYMLMSNGTISDCHTPNDGGGINIVGEDTTGIFRMTGGTIIGCSALYGGGVSSYNNAHIIIDGGKIEECTASGNGGALNGCGEGYRVAIDILSGSIKNCSAPMAGAISTYQNVSITMTGGLIDGCTATESNGGGLTMGSDGSKIPDAYTSFTMSGGTISNCSAASSGGGGITMYEMNNTANTLTINGGTISNCSAGFGGGIWMNGGNSIFTMNDGTISNCKALEGSGGGLQLQVQSTLLTGGTIEDCTALFNNNYAYSGGGVHISATGSDSKATLSGVLILNCSSVSGGGVGVYGNITVEMTGGLISSCHAINPIEDSWRKGGGIFCNGDVKLILSGGEINNCTALNGGGIFLTGENHSFTMSGGTISDCSADYCGGGLFLTGGGNSSTMNGGSIRNCFTSNYGGGFCLSGATLSMSGGEISGCEAHIGGGIRLNDASTLKLSNTAIIDSCTGNYGWAISHDSSQDILHCEDGTYVDAYIEGYDANAVHDDNA